MERDAATPVHPDPEELECFDREPGALARGRSDFIAAHLRTCVSCADELSALRHHTPERLRDLSTPPASRRRWRLLWNPTFALVLVGLLALPVLYQRVGPFPEGPAKESLPASPVAQTVSPPDGPTRRGTSEAALEAKRGPGELGGGAASERDGVAVLGESISSKAIADAAPAVSPDGVAGGRAQAHPKEAPIAEGYSLEAPRADLHQVPVVRLDPSDGSAPPRGAAKTPKRELRPEAPSPALRRAPAPLAAEEQEAFADDAATAGRLASAATPEGDDAESVRPDAMESSNVPSRQRKNADPLAHHVFIPTLRLRPGQMSWGPVSELGTGFFLEIPLPRNTEAGSAQVLIIPEGLRSQQARRRESLSVETRALDSLAHKDTDDTPLPREFSEEVPVEASQRSLILQIPGGVFEVGRYRVDLELHSDGKIRGRGRFRLELLDE